MADETQEHILQFWPDATLITRDSEVHSTSITLRADFGEVKTVDIYYTVAHRNEYTPGTMSNIPVPFLTNVDYLHQTLIYHSFWYT